MGFTFGSSSLLSQHILTNYYSIIFSKPISKEKIEDKINKKEMEEKEEKKEENNKILNKQEENDYYENSEVKNLKNILKQRLIEQIKNNNKDDKIQIMKNIKSNYRYFINSIKSSKIEKKMSKESKTKLDSFWIVCITTFAAYMIKYRLTIFISNLRDNNEEENYKKDNNTVPIDFLNYMDNKTNNNTIHSFSFNDKELFLFICGIYFVCILVSILIYWIFKCCIISDKEENNNSLSINNEEKKLKQKKDKSRKCLELCYIYKKFFEILNCFFYIESNIIDNKNRKIGCCTVCGETIKHYFNEAFCNILNNVDIEIKCCSCCKDYDQEDYNKNQQCFCYCYQKRGCCDWIDKFITNETQKEIVPCMILYFISKLIIIGCEREYENMIENGLFNVERKNNFVLYFFSSYFLFIFFISMIKIMKRKYTSQEDYNLGSLSIFIKYSHEIVIESYIIIIYNSLLTSGFAINTLLDRFKKERDNILFMAILFSKFFIFSLNFYCVNVSKNQENNDILFSQSTLITIYLIIIDGIILIINWIIEDINIIYIFQAIIGCSIYIFFLFMIILFYLKIYSFILYFNGFCLCQCCCCYENTSCECCYCRYCDSQCSYRENCKLLICEICNN